MLQCCFSEPSRNNPEPGNNTNLDAKETILTDNSR